MNSHTSEDYRKSGNCLYEKSQKCQTHEKLQYIEKALTFYNQAIISSSQDSLDFKFANKNAFLCYLNLCKLGDDVSKKKYNFVEGAKCATNALVNHFFSIERNENFETWAQNLFKIMDEFVKLFLDFVSDLACNDAQVLLYKFTSVIRYLKRISSSNQFYKFRKVFEETFCDFYLRQIDILYNYAHSEIADKNYTKGNELIRVIYPLINESKSYSPSTQHINGLFKSVVELEAKGKALKCFNSGCKNLDIALNYEVTIDMDHVWAAMDHFRESLIENQGESVEIICMATTKIGIIYYKLLKTGNTKSKKLFEDVKNLASTLEVPLEKFDWYKEVEECLEQIIAETKPAGEIIENREEIKEKIKDKLDNLEDLSRKFEKKHTQFCLAIIEAFPPLAPCESNKIPNHDHTDKKNLRNAVAIYHPDKNRKDVYGPENYILCEEISKHLTKRLHRVMKESSV